MRPGDYRIQCDSIAATFQHTVVTRSIDRNSTLLRDDLELFEDCMNWLILLVAGLFEVAWAIGLKYTDGFSRPWPSVATAAAMVASVVLLGMAMKTLPVGTAYAVWVGIGAVGTAILGIVLLGEAASAGRLVSLALIVAGVIGLKIATPA
jgi:quaternary ammonium compound-resistance protein SugE